MVIKVQINFFFYTFTNFTVPGSDLNLWEMGSEEHWNANHAEGGVRFYQFFFESQKITRQKKLFFFVFLVKYIPTYLPFSISKKEKNSKSLAAKKQSYQQTSSS